MNYCKYYAKGLTKYSPSCTFGVKEKLINKKDLVNSGNSYCSYCHRPIYIIDFL